MTVCEMKSSPAAFWVLKPMLLKAPSFYLTLEALKSSPVMLLEYVHSVFCTLSRHW